MARVQFISLLLVVCAFHSICAQTTYKGVTLDRGTDSETNCIYIFNDNADSVRVHIQYKIGNRNTEWIDYPIPNLIPPSTLEPEKVGCIDSVIIGLNLVDVKIVKDCYNHTTDKPELKKQEQKNFFQKIKSWFSKE